MRNAAQKPPGNSLSELVDLTGWKLETVRRYARAENWRRVSRGRYVIPDDAIARSPKQRVGNRPAPDTSSDYPTVSTLSELVKTLPNPYNQMEAESLFMDHYHLLDKERAVMAARLEERTRSLEGWRELISAYRNRYGDPELVTAEAN